MSVELIIFLSWPEIGHFLQPHIPGRKRRRVKQKRRKIRRNRRRGRRRRRREEVEGGRKG
jgi:hypothetical protein